MQQRMDHAVVIGASMGGLLAARVLSERFGHVTILDRDRMPPVGEPRNGVPQGRHPHVLLGRGRDILEELFPGLTDELVQWGAVSGDLQASVRWINEGYQVRQAPTGIRSVSLTRFLLEGMVRQHVTALPNVKLVERCDVTGLAADGNRTRVTGVHLRSRDDGDVRSVTADLVVDASGRGSATPAWLAAMGYPQPTCDEMRIDTSYTTRIYRREPAHLNGGSGLGRSPSAGLPRFGAVLAIEGNRWMAGMGGMLGDAAPTDPDGYIAFAASLGVKEIHDIVRGAEPLSDPVIMRFPSNLRRRYERLDRFPEGYVVFGDAICSFNPIYGQGMTVAAAEALALRRCLQAGLAGLGRRFFRHAAKALKTPWEVTVGGDLRFPDVVGHRTKRVRMFNAYVMHLHQAASVDTAVGRTFLRVANLLDPPTRLLSPVLALRMARAKLRGRAARPDPWPAEPSASNAPL